MQIKSYHFISYEKLGGSDLLWVQFHSSEPSSQVKNPSHTNCPEMHTLLSSHWKLPFLQRKSENYTGYYITILTFVKKSILANRPPPKKITTTTTTNTHTHTHTHTHTNKQTKREPLIDMKSLLEAKDGCRKLYMIKGTHELWPYRCSFCLSSNNDYEKRNDLQSFKLPTNRLYRFPRFP